MVRKGVRRFDGAMVRRKELKVEGKIAEYESSREMMESNGEVIERSREMMESGCAEEESTGEMMESKREVIESKSAE
jgi:hypothetical protein